MIVPKHWAEAKLKKRVKNRSITIKRYGWSDDSIEDAQQKANQRAEEAMSTALLGKNIARIERKLPYNGADGVPIREEIVEEIKDSVITRNSYGALCINTPDVLFADIDFEDQASSGFYFLTLLSLITCLVVLGFSFDFCTHAFIDLRSKISFNTFSSVLESLQTLSFSECLTPVFWGLMLATVFLASLISKLWNTLAGGVQAQAMRKIKKFSKKNPTWNLHIYRTPAGFRVLVLHKTFDPNSTETLGFFHALNTDRVYVQMCKNQRCFRARVSPKPWRIGIANPMKPRTAVWPISEDKLPERERWIETYERAARNYASCRFEEQLGSTLSCSKAEYIRSVHDKYCKAKTSLEIA